jgi:TonB-linked SusC/RagA family outer membrane protein
MKRILLTLIMLLSVGLGTAVAQNIIRGRILDEKGQGLPGAGISVKGSPTVGTVTDLDGNFELAAPAGSTLVVQSIGYSSVEIAPGATTTLTLRPAAKELSGAVVTALGIRREKREISYAATTVTSEELNQGNQVSALSSLQGKTAGVNITSSTGGPGGSTRVVLRGEKSIGGGNNALIVVDGVPINNGSRTTGRISAGTETFLENVDFGNRGNDINPEDIESITVLKGPAAAALYGSAGANGAVMITTKSGRSRTRGGRARTEVSYNTSYTLSNILRYPEFQTKYGQGNKEFGADKVTPEGIPDDRRENFSWGLPFDGEMRPWGQVINGKQQFKPYSDAGNNLKEFFNTGRTWENNLAFGGATEKSSYYLSLNTLNNKGVTPNTFFDKYSIRFNGSSELSNNVYTSINVNYMNIYSRVEEQGQGNGATWDNVLQTPRDIHLRPGRDYNGDIFNSQSVKDSSGVERYGYWNNFALNPFWIADNFDNRGRTDRVLGNAIIGYRKGKFNIFNRLGADVVADRQTFKTPAFNAVPFEDESAQTPFSYTYLSSYPTKFNAGFREVNINTRNLYNDLIAQYITRLSEDINLNVLLGNSIIANRGTVLEADIDPNTNGLVVPNFYSFTNATNPVLTNNSTTGDFTVGLYGQVRTDYKNALFLDITGRNDWSSTLAPGNRSFFYPSVGLSWVITETFKNMSWTESLVSFAKLRTSYASVGKGASAYQNNDPAFLRGEVTTGFSTINFPFNNGVTTVPGFSRQFRLGNESLRPERTNAYEAGLELGLLRNRISFEVTYYNNESIDQIVSVPIAPSSGYTSRVVNLGDMTNKGIELASRLTLVRSANNGFRWDAYGTYTKNKNMVTRLPEGTTRISLGGASGAAAYAAVGLPYGAFFATDLLRTSTGQVVVDSATGQPKLDPNQVYRGTFQPKFVASWGTTLSFKGLSLNVLFDTKQGGVFFSGTKDLMDFVGTAPETENRDHYVFPNSVYENYAGAYVTNNEKFSPYYYYSTVIPDGQHFVDASYVKLREASLNYTVPQSIAEKTPFGNLTIGIYGSNLFIWTAEDNKYVDPETNTAGATNLQGFEFRARPSLRNYGFRLGITF